MYVLFCLYCVWNTFFWLYRSVGFEGNIRYAKRGITSAPKCANFAGFTFATWQIISCLLCKFISPEVLVINLFKHLRIFLVRWGNSSEFLGLSKWVTRFEEKFSICWGKTQLARTSKGKTLSVLKLAGESVNFGLCNYLDYFPCPLIKAQKIYFDF